MNVSNDLSQNGVLQQDIATQQREIKISIGKDFHPSCSIFTSLHTESIFEYTIESLSKRNGKFLAGNNILLEISTESVPSITLSIHLIKLN